MKTTAAKPILQVVLPSAAWPGLCAVLLAASPPATAQLVESSATGEKSIYESAAANRVLDKVRAQAQGVMVGVFVKPGDAVKKDQLLGHLDLDTAKFQLDLAQAALDAKGNIEAAKGQAEAWSATREETEESVRKRRAEKIRLVWATAMEKMYQGTYEVQLDLEKTQAIQQLYWKDQYEKRFFRAPVDGVVAEVLAEPGKTVGIATHVFTIRNDNLLSIPVSVPEAVARTACSGETLPVRPVNDKFSTRALVDSVSDNPVRSGDKIFRLLIPAAAFPVAIRSRMSGAKFEVLFPMAERADPAPPHGSVDKHASETRT